jgi:hypothetical protein
MAIHGRNNINSGRLKEAGIAELCTPALSIEPAYFVARPSIDPFVKMRAAGS